MPEVFELHKVVGQTKKDKPIKKRYRTASPKKIPLNQQIIHVAQKYSTRVWSGFYAMLIVASFATGYIVDKSNLAKNIMDWVRAREVNQVQLVDMASINLTTSPGMVAYVIYPDGRRVGDTLDNIRYLEVSTASLTQTQIATNSGQISKAWGMSASQPPNGIYTIYFSSRLTGTYTYYLQTYNLEGIEQISMSNDIEFLTPSQKGYYLTYDKYDSQKIRLVPISTN